MNLVEQLRQRADVLRRSSHHTSTDIELMIEAADLIEQAVDVEFEALVKAVMIHRDASLADGGHGQCWENDAALWRAAGLEVERPELPSWCEFMKRCVEYRQSREQHFEVLESRPLR